MTRPILQLVPSCFCWRFDDGFAVPVFIIVGLDAVAALAELVRG